MTHRAPSTWGDARTVRAVEGTRAAEVESLRKAMGYGDTMAARPLECLGKTRPTRRVPSFILIAVTTITFLSYDKCTSIPLRQSKLTLRQKAAPAKVVARSEPVGSREVREPREAGPVLRATKDGDSDCEFAGGWKVCGKSNRERDDLISDHDHLPLLRQVHLHPTAAEQADSETKSCAGEGGSEERTCGVARGARAAGSWTGSKSDERRRHSDCEFVGGWKI